MELSELKATPERWVDLPAGISVKLRLPSREEFLRDQRLCNKNGNIDERKWAMVMAQKYIIDAKGITEDGSQVTYTHEVGVALLNNLIFSTRIQEALVDFAEWLEEGNE